LKTVQYVVFRYLTDAEFFNIYKPQGTEERGGGQSYIDFPVGVVTLGDWRMFFTGVPSVTRRQGPGWTFRMNSIGLDVVQQLTVFQRRAQSFAVSSQKITSKESNRVAAWHPENGFPQPNDPMNRASCPAKLAIYVVRTDGGEFWAGWFQDTVPCKDEGARAILRDMLLDDRDQGDAGFIAPRSALYLDESNIFRPFYTTTASTQAVTVVPDVTAPRETRAEKATRVRLQRRVRSEEEVTKSLFDEDEGRFSEAEDKLKEVIVKVRSRNARAVQDLKELYRGRCQISGEQLTFVKKDGTLYCEAHHLVPLGNEGADSPYNIIIVSPLIHRMLHYAEVSDIDLSKISIDNKLDMTINGEAYRITWHPEHANHVRSHQAG